MLLEQKGKNLIVITFPVKRAPGPLAAFLRLFPLSASPRWFIPPASTSLLSGSGSCIFGYLLRIKNPP